MRSALLVLISLFALSSQAAVVVGGEDPEAGPPVLGEIGGVALVVPDGAQAGPDFDVDVATEAWLATISAETADRSDAYFEGGYWIQLWSIALTLLIAWGLLHFGVSQRFRDWGQRVTAVRFVNDFVFYAAYSVATFLIWLPLSIYWGFVREHAYDLSNQTFAEWLIDNVKGLGIDLVLAGLGVALLYMVIRRLQRSWWAWGAGLMVAMLAFISLIGPVFLAPMFNDFQPLPEGPMRQRILSMAHANGVPADDVVWSDASRQSTRISANVSGLAGTTRITLNDNLLERSPTESIEIVMGHEIGHYALNHVYESLIYFGLIIVGGFLFVDWGFERVRRRWGGTWGVSGLGDIAGFPLFVALIGTWFFLMTPVFNSVIRSNEAEADIYALNASVQPDGMAYVAMQLAEYRKLRPGYWEEILFFDHPSGYARVRMAMRYKAEVLRQQGVLPPLD
jgi:Zn-dependent protease with chaperone function